MSNYPSGCGPDDYEEWMTGTGQYRDPFYCPSLEVTAARCIESGCAEATMHDRVFCAVHNLNWLIDELIVAQRCGDHETAAELVEELQEMGEAA
jgi:hypothetical protein